MPKNFLNAPGYPRGLRNNNPGNIRDSDNWQGEIGVDAAGFTIFKDCSWGLRALAIDLSTKIRTGYNTIRKIITRYAPPNENDTEAYISSVVGYTGMGSNTELTADANTLARLMRAIMNVELGASFSNMLTASDINEGISMMGSTAATPGQLATGAGIAGILFLVALYALVTMPKMPKRAGSS